MNRRSTLSFFATSALGLALLGITAGSTAGAAEIKLLCAVALQPAFDALIPEFEKSSGHKVTVAYGNAGAIADRFQKGGGCRSCDKRCATDGATSSAGHGRG